MALLDIVIIFGIFGMSIVLHEVAHGYAAYRLGDPTAYLQGRLTLNPIKHIDPIWSILVPAVMLFTMGFIFGGAKPVPVNPLRFRNMRKGMMWTSIAGPATNIGIALVLAAVLALTVVLRESFQLPRVRTEIWFSFGIQINVLLAFFNLIPIPPLDGSRVLAGIVSRETARKIDALEPYGIFILVGLLYMSGGAMRWLIEGVLAASRLLGAQV